MPLESLTANSLAQQVKSIPTLPTVLTELSRRMEDPKTSSDDLAQIIQQDQAISSKVLKLVNSPFYGYSGRIHTINQGIVILGFNAIKNLVLSTSVIEAFKGAASSEAFRMDLLWVHSAAVAGVAKLLAERSGAADPEEAFVSGLLHDIGKVLLWISEPRLFAGCLMASASKRIPLMDVERQVAGFDDSELASVLAEKWKFPNTLRESIRWRSLPERAGAMAPLASAVHCANVVCTSLGAASVPKPVLTAPSAVAWELMGLHHDDRLRNVLHEAPLRIEAARAFVSS
ncbi:MAG: HDOD domain-containing protein [Fibrobacteres bacterium]|nr:HDOD domain-containing protein [Fibrobacterota bacterium]